MLAGVAAWIGGATPASRLTLIAVACIALAVAPVRALDVLPELCIWCRVFGYCPFHGTTHALAALLHGDVAGAVAYNPLVLAIAPLTAGTALLDLRRLGGAWIRGHRPGLQQSR